MLAYSFKFTVELKKRSDLATMSKMSEEKTFDADTESTGMVMHKDSRWSQNWQNFKDNNQYMHSEFIYLLTFCCKLLLLVIATRLCSANS